MINVFDIKDCFFRHENVGSCPPKYYHNYFLLMFEYRNSINSKLWWCQDISESGEVSGLNMCEHMLAI